MFSSDYEDFNHQLEQLNNSDIIEQIPSYSKETNQSFIRLLENEIEQQLTINTILESNDTELKINIIGLMAIPPYNQSPEKYFNEISTLNSNLGLKHLSLGMSNDYALAIKHKSTFVRIGSAILGQRNSN